MIKAKQFKNLKKGHIGKYCIFSNKKEKNIISLIN